MRKRFAKVEIVSRVLTFDKFITNVHKKEKRLHSRNHSILVNANLNVKCCLNDEKRAWNMIVTKCWYKIKLKTLKFFRRQQRFKQRFDIWNSFCNSENAHEIDFRIQIFVCNDDKYERKKCFWKSWYFEMRS